MPTPRRSNVSTRSTSQENSQESVSRQRNSKTNKRKQATPRKRPAALTNVQRQQKLLQEINRLRGSTENQIPKLPFYRLVKEILIAHSRSDIRVTPLAIQALQESAELYLTNLMEDAYRTTLHRQRVTLSVQDIQLVRYLRGRSDPGNA